MKLARFSLKLYAAPSAHFEAERVVPVFHRFIREHLLDDVLIDVADYAHVHEGPGVVLIGHATDHYVDFGEGRTGLLFTRKREGPEGAFERMKDALERTLLACDLLAREPDLGLAFQSGELRFIALDRLEARNDDASFAAVKPELVRAVSAVYGDLPVELAREGSEKEPLTVRVRISGAPDVPTLLSRLRS